MVQLILFTLLGSICLGHFVFLFFKTDFVVEYGKLLGLSKFFHEEEYRAWQVHNIEGYPVFIREKYPNFWGHLVGCPLCLPSFISWWSGILWALATFTLWPVIIGGAVGGLAVTFYLSLNWLYNKNFSNN